MHHTISWTRWTRTAAGIGLVALTLGAPGCGDNDDSGGGGGGSGAADSAAATAPTTPQAGGGDGASGSSSVSGNHIGRAAEIDKVLTAVQEDFIAVDGASYCSHLTEAGVRQVVQFGKTLGHGNDCVKIIDRVAKNTRDSGIEQKPTKLISVKFAGNRAVAKVRDGGRPPEPMVFVNEDGDWKIPDPGFKPKFGGTKALESDPTARFEQVLRFQQKIERRDKGQ